MTGRSAPYGTTIIIDHRREMEDKLNELMGEAIRQALRTSNQGIVVTRHDERTFSVQLSAEVAPGTTMECDLWRVTPGTN